MVNNSADFTTLEMFDILAKYKDEDIHVYTVLSYISKGQEDYRLKIMQKGYETFGVIDEVLAISKCRNYTKARKSEKAHSNISTMLDELEFLTYEYFKSSHQQ